MTPADHSCCDAIVRTESDVKTLFVTTAATKADAQKWRDDHEARQAETVARMFDAIERQGVELNKRLEAIEDKLANRLPPWATAIAAVMAAVIGSLTTIVVMLSNHFLA